MRFALPVFRAVPCNRRYSRLTLRSASSRQRMAHDPAESEPPEAPSLTTCFVREAIVQYRGRALRTAPIREPLQAIDLARRIVQDHAR